MNPGSPQEASHGPQWVMLYFHRRDIDRSWMQKGEMRSLKNKSVKSEIPLGGIPTMVREKTFLAKARYCAASMWSPNCPEMR
jgi:hypothetical protein